MTRQTIFFITALTLLSGLGFRLYPMIAGQPLLSQFFVTEDGYLLLTVARNMAIGLGMTVSDGTIPTNGVQPLITFLFSAVYMLSAGDKVTSLYGVHLIMIIISVGVFFAIRAFAERMFECLENKSMWAILAASLWFVGNITLRHSMNALETGLITLMLVLTLLKFHSVIFKGNEETLRGRLTLGALAGVTFLARIDAAIFCIVLWSVWMFHMLYIQKYSIATTLSRLVPPGFVCLAIASPWLLNNALRFGSLMPSSGTAQSLNHTFGQNAGLLPSRLFEYLFPMLPLPNFLDAYPAAVLVCSLTTLVTLTLFLVRIIPSSTSSTRLIIITYSLHLLFLVIYYGFNYGAGHFLSRYLAPSSPLLIVAGIWLAIEVGGLLIPQRPYFFAKFYCVGGLVLSLILLGRLAVPGVTTQGHFQVVDWVSENISDKTWVGAVQTGTLGYWHDRTINLDGKVNPEALAARIEFGSVLPYVVSSEIEYIVDWAGVSNWASKPEGNYSEVFETLFVDQENNISVQRRRFAR